MALLPFRRSSLPAAGERASVSIRISYRFFVRSASVLAVSATTHTGVWPRWRRTVKLDSPLPALLSVLERRRGATRIPVRGSAAGAARAAAFGAGASRACPIRQRASRVPTETRSAAHASSLGSVPRPSRRGAAPVCGCSWPARTRYFATVRRTSGSMRRRRVGRRQGVRSGRSLPGPRRARAAGSSSCRRAVGVR